MDFFRLKICIIAFLFVIICVPQVAKADENFDINSKSAVLIEGKTGKILFEKEKDLKVNPASITKIMSLLLTFEELDEKNITLEDTVTVSEHAASMGGSQVFLEVNETQTLKDMIKCICIASANDACVAVAEYIAGSETEFVNRMNERAKELGMQNTHFVNCCGLDVDNHYSTAYDVGLMSRELIMNHEEIKEYTTTWMDSIIHTTKKGQKEFGLTNTNKLVRTYDGITGLKTGSTSLAKYCLSATASRNGVDLIAVVMSAPEHKLRYTEAAKLLDYGFANCKVFSSKNTDYNLKNINVIGGNKKNVKIKVEDIFTYVLTDNKDTNSISFEIDLPDKVNAPIKKDDKVGKVNFILDNNVIGSVDILSSENIKKASLWDCILKTGKKFLFL